MSRSLYKSMNSITQKVGKWDEIIYIHDLLFNSQIFFSFRGVNCYNLGDFDKYYKEL